MLTFLPCQHFSIYLKVTEGSFLNTIQCKSIIITRNWFFLLIALNNTIGYLSNGSTDNVKLNGKNYKIKHKCTIFNEKNK